MAFGQRSGPPATARQMQDLTSLILAAGHTGFRDARGPLGLTQRQAGGRFTREEADALIARLEAEADGVVAVRDERPPASSSTPPTTHSQSGAAGTLHSVPDSVLAAELQRRGWIVMEP